MRWATFFIIALIMIILAGGILLLRIGTTEKETRVEQAGTKQTSCGEFFSEPDKKFCCETVLKDQGAFFNSTSQQCEV